MPAHPPTPLPPLSQFWQLSAAGTDACVSAVLETADLLQDPHLSARSVYTVSGAGLDPGNTLQCPSFCCVFVFCSYCDRFLVLRALTQQRRPRAWIAHPPSRARMACWLVSILWPSWRSWATTRRPLPP